jgi:tRNA A-37 threonylcarbamoyl transferase component Bud32
MSQARLCPECETELPEDAPEALCPKCLLQQGLSDSDEDVFAANGPATEPHGDRPAIPTPAELASAFPHLQILELLGQGGMGAVYKARQIKLDRLVALKVLPRQINADPTFAERFTREARSLARLNHPNIVTVHDFGEVDGLYYFIMEYVDGVSLRHLIHAGQPGAEESLKIVPQICDALQYAHEEGIVHRDIKPENILLDKRGRVKIADFGLAKLVSRTPADFTLSTPQQVMGTLLYMAPEQMERPHTVDHRADIYSLGVVFYELLTGELPLGRFAPPSHKVAVDGRLDQVVLRALEKEPAERYQHISDVKSDVEAIAGPGPLRRPAVPWAFPHDRELIRHRLIVPAAGLIFAGLLSFASWIALGMILTNELSRWGGPQPAVVLLGLILLCPIAVASGVLIVGGLKMMRFESYTFAITACIWALLPWALWAWPFSLVFGIWALRILRKPEVQTAFLGRPLTGLAAPTPPTVPATPQGRVRSFVKALRYFVIDSMISRPSRAIGSVLGKIRREPAREQPPAGLGMNSPLPPRREVQAAPSPVPGSKAARSVWIMAILAAGVIFGFFLLCMGVLTVWYESRRSADQYLAATVSPSPMKPDTLDLDLPDAENRVLLSHLEGILNGDRSRIEKVRDVLRATAKDYESLEKRHTSREKDKNGRLVVKIDSFPDELDGLLDKMWSRLDPLLNERQQGDLRSQLAVSPIYHGYQFPLGRKKVTIDLWRVGTWYHWMVSESTTPPSPTRSGQSPHLPKGLARFWTDKP